jgi:hypothetical protein
MTALEEATVEDSMPSRSIVVLAPDTQEEEFPRVETAIRAALGARGIETPKWDQWRRRYTRLKALVVPADIEQLRDSIRIGTNRIIAIDAEHMSTAPPGDEPQENLNLAVDPLKATGVLNSTATGEGVRVWVLDFGFFSDHPDFKTRNPLPKVKTFTNGDPLKNAAHGTRSMGLACGPEAPIRALVTASLSRPTFFLAGWLCAMASSPTGLYSKRSKKG